MQNRQKCFICSERPASPKQITCAVCRQQIAKAGRANHAEQPEKYLTYRGYVVGLFKAHDKNGVLQARPLGRSADHLPKGQTINLNEWVDGFSRDEVKRFKATILSLCEPHARYMK